MFGLLKNKLKNFIDGIVAKKQESMQAAQAAPAAPAAPAVPAAPLEAKHGAETRKSVEEEILEEARHETAREAAHEAREAALEAAREKMVETPAVFVEVKRVKVERVEAEAEKKFGNGGEREKEKEKPYFEVREEKKELKPKLSLLSRVKSLVSSEVNISKSDVQPFLQDLEVALLESDVSFEATQFLLGDLQKRLVGKRIAKNALASEVQAEVRNALLDLFPRKKIDLVEEITRKRVSREPYVILFLGPNGSGKTTTIAKIAARLRDEGFSSVISASDSFRAAAIEQAVHHGEKLGVKVVKHAYGADPTAVAFDAVAHARANGVNVVLVDTAGRQETNFNLVKEMEKMNRVLKPDLRVFVGEALAGHALVEQVKTFKEKVGVDAVVLTKLDCDAKGGGVFSIAFESKLPVLFLGVGQEYFDLRDFDAEWLVDNVLAA